MNIYAKEGHKVIADNLYWDYPGDTERVQKCLVKGQVYTIQFTVVGDWYTTVQLKEFPGVYFNSVHFRDAEDV